MQHSKCCVRNVPRVRIPNSPPKREVMLWHCFSFLFGIRTRREQTCLRKKTVLWTVFADVVKEQSDAKAYGSMPKKSLTLRQSGKQVIRPAFCFGKTKRGIRTRREQTCLRKKTVRWIVFADVVKERSDAKAYGTFLSPLSSRTSP